MNNTIDYRATLLAQFEGMKSLPMFLRMATTVEGSPWHREANVLVHTQMVVDEYVKLVDDYDPHSRMEAVWNHEDYLGGIAAVFHDTGKPTAEIEKWSETRGKYRAYHGHELLSARNFEAYAAHRFPMFSAKDIFKVSWMIEHHMPWTIEDKEKLDRMAMTVKYFDMSNAFTSELLADQYGRIADDQVAKNARALEWVMNFSKHIQNVELPTMQFHPEAEHNCVLWMPIAPSGAGKSTFLKKVQANYAFDGKQLRVFSLDALRHEFYDPVDYANAYRLSVADKSFEARANARFHADVKWCIANNAGLYVDNTNLSARRRKWYLDIVRKQEFKTVAVVFPVELDVLLARQKTRGDKCVPDSAVKQQYMSLQAPMMGEFDDIIVSDSNLSQQT